MIFHQFSYCLFILSWYIEEISHLLLTLPSNFGGLLRKPQLYKVNNLWQLSILLLNFDLIKWAKSILKYKIMGSFFVAGTFWSDRKLLDTNPWRTTCKYLMRFCLLAKSRQDWITLIFHFFMGSPFKYFIEVILDRK